MTDSGVGSRVEVALSRPATGGAIGRLPDGRVLFARLGLPAERVVVEITALNRRFARGEVVEVLDASPHRVSPPCPFAGPGACGGCDLQQADVSAQLEWKAFVARGHLERAGRVVDLAVAPAPSAARGSRVRLRAAVDALGRLGLRRHASHEVEPLTSCWLADARLAEAFARRWSGEAEVELRAIGDGEPVAVLARPGGPIAVGLDGGQRAEVVARTEVGESRFRVSPGSFWQSHRDAPAVLTEEVLRSLSGVSTTRVVDLYSGVGLFAVALARSGGDDVVAVESHPSAVADARENARGLPVEVLEAPVTPTLVSEVVGEGDVVVLDPPRRGAGVEVARAIARRRPTRVVYVSCDAATLARDLDALEDEGLRLVSISAHDLFPMTEHLELVAVLDGTGPEGQAAR